MNTRWAGTIMTTLLLGACSANLTGTTESPEALPVPGSVIALADPSQNLQTARLRPEDGCYWYLHSGPVETTLLPLRTSEGRSICTATGTSSAS
ncbi:hypothetical protein GCM10011392_11500 [Wenxinia marina]|uniref:Lipoprotein n=1 Tax=Wenxinia marina DSM 24838 TaxID=1123501 RepID=A0A0D0QEQ0_9RHOB|nr:hypothetical protein Wenmar_01845 [Wenxinia marina DSM 24838]GGL58709.1 hypothetical protein GCM10011392_11500 [Wenxinia marina]